LHRVFQEHSFLVTKGSIFLRCVRVFADAYITRLS